jgi:glutaconate CoA-transferase subunit B
LRYAKEYTNSELMAVLAAREIIDGEKVLVGIGTPMIAGFLAIHTHAPNCMLIFEAGYTGGQQPFACTDVGDSVLGYKSPYITSLWRVFSDLQRGFFDLAIIGAAQVDRYGNVNTTALFKDGNCQRPTIRLPGSGGANDMASSAKRSLIMTRLEKRRFVPRVDYITSPGYLDGPKARKKAGLKGDGPIAVITDKAIFRFDENTKEMFLESVCPNVDVDDVKREVGFDFCMAQEVRVVRPPTIREISFIRSFDPLDIILRRRPAFKEASFQKWCTVTRNAIARAKE